MTITFIYNGQTAIINEDLSYETEGEEIGLLIDAVKVGLIPYDDYDAGELGRLADHLEQHGQVFRDPIELIDGAVY